MLTAEPAPYVPPALGEETRRTLAASSPNGAVSLMAMILPEAPSEPASPGRGSVRLALLPTASLMVPPLSTSASVPV